MQANPRPHRLSDGRLRQLVWALAVAGGLLQLGALAHLLTTLDATYSLGWGFPGFSIIFGLLFVVVAVPILNRYPRHIVGWLLLSMGLASSVQGIVQEYSVHANVIAPGSLAGGAVAAWIINWIWVLVTAPLIFIPLYFPNGRLPSPRWRILAWFGLGAVTLQSLVFMFAPGTLDSSFRFIDNPFGIQGVDALFQVLEAAGFVGWIVVLAGGAVSILVRFRRSPARQRQQIKWLVFATVLVALTAPAGASRLLAVQLIFISAMLFLPASIAIAVLRYGLFDIDLIIRRTILYSALSAALALLYFGIVAILQALVTAVGGRQSAVITVASTLAIAALFTPLRRRLQAVIDRRFYRRKYDAAQTLAAFGATARDETDLNQLSGRLIDVVHATVQPAQAWLWLPGEERQP